MSTAERRLALTAGIAGICGLILLFGGLPVPLTAVAGALLAFGVPGYALTRVLFAGARLDTAERTVLVLGLGFSVTIVVGFLLHLAPAGLSAATWGVSLAVIAMLSCGIAFFLEPRPSAARPPAAPIATARPAGVLGPVQRPPAAPVPVQRPLGGRQPAMPSAVAPTTLGQRPVAGRMPAPQPSPRPSEAVSADEPVEISRVQLGMLIAAGVVVLVALMVARIGVGLQSHPGTTALWVRPSDTGTAIGLGISNQEGHRQTYRLEVSVDGSVIARVVDMSVNGGATDERKVGLPPAGAVLRDVQVRIWFVDAPPGAEPYRSVRLTLRATAPIAVPAATPAATPAIPVPSAKAPQ